MTTSRRFRQITQRQSGFALSVWMFCLFICGWLWLEPTPNLLAPSDLESMLQKLGVFGPVVYMAVLALSVVVSPIPGAPLAIVGGMVWPLPLAGLYSVIGGFLGSLLAYWIGCTLGHTAIRSLTGKSIYVTPKWSDRYGGWLIFFSRLLPVFPFDVLSYVAGITQLPLKIYAPATLLGMIPPIFVL